jgi:hypothetical protein
MPVSVKGGVELRKALRNFAPDLAKETQKEIAGVLKPIVKEARGYIPSESPLSNWAKEGGRFPAFNSTIMKRGIGYKTTPSKANRRGFRALAQIRNMSAAGAIYETAGRKAPGTKPSSRPNFSEAMGPLSGSANDRGRAIFQAWEKDYGKATLAVVKAIENAGKKFNATVGKR